LAVFVQFTRSFPWVLMLLLADSLALTQSSSA